MKYENGNKILRNRNSETNNFKKEICVFDKYETFCFWVAIIDLFGQFGMPFANLCRVPKILYDILM